MYAAPAARVAYWVVSRGGRAVLRRVPANVLSSARRTSQAWRGWGNRFAGVVGRTLGAGASASAAVPMVVGMKRRRRTTVSHQRKRARTNTLRNRARKIKTFRARRPVSSRRKGIRAAAPGSSRTRVYKRSTLRKYTPVKPKLQVAYVIQRHQGIKPENPDQDPDDAVYDYPGYYIMARGLPTDVPVNQPVMCFHLTGFNQTASPGELFRIQIAQTGVPVFGTQTCQTSSSGNVTSAWQREDGRHDNAGATKHIQFAWYDIRLKMYGARKQPVTYDVHLVSFKRDWMDPLQNVVASNPEDTLRRHFYQNLCKTYVSNSIMPGVTDWRKLVTFHKSKRIELPASSTDDLDRNPESVDLKWFIRDGKVRMFTEAASAFGNDEGVMGTDWIDIGNTVVSNAPPARQRLWLLICATDMTVKTATEDQDDNASFDMVIRRKAFKYSI